MRTTLPLTRGTAKGLWASRPVLRRSIIPIALLLLYLASPYVTLWRLSGALVADDREALAAMVDLEAIRDELRRRLNKEAESRIGPLSDGFIDWLEQGIRRNGVAAIEHQVTLDWVRERLLAHSPPDSGLWPALEYAFFDHPLHVTVRLGDGGGSSVVGGLGLGIRGWRLTSLYDR